MFVRFLQRQTALANLRKVARNPGPTRRIQSQTEKEASLLRMLLKVAVSLAK